MRPVPVRVSDDVPVLVDVDDDWFGRLMERGFDWLGPVLFFVTGFLVATVVVAQIALHFTAR